MTLSPYENISEKHSPLGFVASGKAPSLEKMPGHWVLASAGKRVLRTGGIELTRRMLDALAIGSQERVVEFAPGLGATARLVLERRPSAYCAVERDPAAAGRLRHQLAGTVAEIVLGEAQKSGLPDRSATAVYGEAMLSMQSLEQKRRIFAEARRLLTPGGRYGIHELCFLPDDIPAALRHEIQAEMSKEIHVGVQPLSRNEWISLFQENGMTVTWSAEAPMHLLEPWRMLADEGFSGGVRIAFNMMTQPVLRSRILAMRRLFRKYKQTLGAIAMVGTLEKA
ncbi:MAG: class I SAM-dependent methyltransferase [Terriglobales bacterium]